MEFCYSDRPSMTLAWPKTCMFFSSLEFRVSQCLYNHNLFSKRPLLEHDLLFIIGFEVLFEVEMCTTRGNAYKFILIYNIWWIVLASLQDHNSWYKQYSSEDRNIFLKAGLLQEEGIFSSLPHLHVPSQNCHISAQHIKLTHTRWCCNPGNGNDSKKI